MPNVSPGHTDGSPNSVETWTGWESQPRVVEKARRYCAYPAGLLSESQPTYAIPDPPPATCMMCGTSSWSEGACDGVDQCWPWSVEKESQPTSFALPSAFVPCVSQVAYRLPPASIAMSPSIHHSARDIVPPCAPTLTGADQVAPWSVEDVK